MIMKPNINFTLILFSEAVDPAHPEPGPAPGPQRRVAASATGDRQHRYISSTSGLDVVLRGQDEITQPRAGAEEGGEKGT